jgi:branched-chain amino acid transport system ATP-binding protein
LLEVQKLSAHYGAIRALHNVSLKVEEGQFVSLIGANGAGKSTLLKTAMGLIEDQPDKGTIWFDGRRIDGKDTEDIVRRGIAYVPEGREVFEELTVVENLAMGAYLRRDRAGIARAMDRVFRLFPPLAERQRHLAGHMSGGEQQMLAIGRALMGKPRLLFLDEPSLGLSPILAVIKQINAEQGTTILLVEQNARMALSIADYGFVLENGRIVLDGTAADLLEDEDVKEFYLGLKSEVSVKGYQRWKRKKRWR